MGTERRCPKVVLERSAVMLIGKSSLVANLPPFSKQKERTNGEILEEEEDAEEEEEVLMEANSRYRRGRSN